MDDAHASVRSEAEDSRRSREQSHPLRHFFSLPVNNLIGDHGLGSAKSSAKCEIGAHSLRASAATNIIVENHGGRSSRVISSEVDLLRGKIDPSVGARSFFW